MTAAVPNTGRLILPFLVLCALGSQIASGQAPADKDAKEGDPLYLPPFPSLFFSQDKPPVSRGSLAKIVTESVSYNGAISTQEEYIDTSDSRFAYVLRETQEVIYVSASEGLTDSLILKYKPYTCDSFKADDAILQPVDDLSVIGQRGFRVFGVTGLWKFAESAPKSYATITLNYGIKDFEKKYHVWRFTHVKNYQVKFHFNEAETLEKVEIMNESGGIVKTISVLSIEFEFDQRILEVPVGFGCAKHVHYKPDQDEDDIKAAKDDFWSTYFWLDSRVKLEVTGTKMGGEKGRSSDTMYVELAHARIDEQIVGPSLRHDLYLTKVKSKLQETRTILNHIFNVRYHIDARTGQCDTSHLAYDSLDEAAQDLRDEANDDLALKFSNGLQFPFHKQQIKALFSIEPLMLPIKRVVHTSPDNTQRIEYTILEQPTFEWPYGTQKVMARVMATMVVTKDLPTNRYSEPRLESVTVWLLPPEQTKILESYHFSVIEEEGPLELWPDVAHLFDVSEECYLGRPDRKAGLDYAWLELFYPLASRVMDSLIQEEFQLKQRLYAKLLGTRLFSAFSVPRLEVMFADEGLTVRFLTLDLPDFELLFELKEGRMLTRLGDTSTVLAYNLPDERHCAKMCQMHECLTMSFCKVNHECAISQLPAKFESAAAAPDPADKERYETLVIAHASCNAYTAARPELMRKLRRQRLANVISELQNQEYDNLGLPQIPEELTMPREELNLSEAELQKIVTEYTHATADYLLKQNSRLPTLTLMLELNNGYQMALPTRFLVESNPLEEFSLAYASGGSGAGSAPDDLQLHDPRQILKFFHVGKPDYRLDLAKTQALSTKLTRSIEGLSYDQCALACLDSKCGLFSHCSYHNGCVISEMRTVQEASELQVLSADMDCIVSQRDYAQHFQKFEDVKNPNDERTSKGFRVQTANDCASDCVTATSFNCYSFEVCKSARDKDLLCYQHERRLTGELEAMLKARDGASQLVGNEERCDHYERSYLAEFTAIELHAFKLEHLPKTSTYYGKTTFECADICLNQLADCSAFEFCFGLSTAPEQKAANFNQQCMMVQGAPADLEADEEREYVVNDERPDVISSKRPDAKRTIRADNGLLESSGSCHVFALKPNTIQAHLRNLALGQTMTRRERQALDLQRRIEGLALSWAGLFLLLLSLATVSGLAGFGLCWARERSGLVRHHLDQARDVLTRPFGRFSR